MRSCLSNNLHIGVFDAIVYHFHEVPSSGISIYAHRVQIVPVLLSSLIWGITLSMHFHCLRTSCLDHSKHPKPRLTHQDQRNELDPTCCSPLSIESKQWELPQSTRISLDPVFPKASQLFHQLGLQRGRTIKSFST